MGEAAVKIVEPKPRYPDGHYDNVGNLHPDFRPPMRHLATFNDLDLPTPSKDNVVELRGVANRLKQIQIQQARDDYLCFVEYCFKDPVTKRMFEPQWFHDDWSISFDEEKRCIVIAPRGHGKTSIVLPYVIWRIGRNVDLRVKIVCADDPTAIKRLKVIKKTIELNPRVREVFPELEPDKKTGWTDHAIFVKRSIIDPEPTIEAKGIGSSIVGSRVDLVIADDIVSIQNSVARPAERKKVIDAWENDWMNLVHDDSQVIYICTLYHRDDNSHKVMKSGAYKKLFYAIDSQYGAMWPDKISELSLRDKRSTMSESAWARGYRNEPKADEDRIIREVWFQYCDIDINEMVQSGWVFFTSYDVATKKGVKNDYFASVTSAVNIVTKDIIIVDAWHDKLTKAQQAKMVFVEYKRYNPFRIFVEIVGNEALDQRILENYPELAGILEPINPHNSKGQRLDAITPFLENGHVWFASHLDPDNPKFKKHRGNLYYELVEFPSDHDDLADSFSQNLDGVRRYHLDTYQWNKENQDVEVLTF
ncbi:MAG: hypothetical protein GY841_15870 [FCB group bacterium]|nr:hypothetical protein [FCB group bacterium]